MTFWGFFTFTFRNFYVLKLLRLETITFSDATLSDINVVLCYFLSQYYFNHKKIRGGMSQLKVVTDEKQGGSEGGKW